MFLASKYNKIILSALVLVLSFLMAAQVVLAAGVEDTSGLNATAQGGFGKQITGGGYDLPTLIGRIVGAGLAFLGVIFFCLILYAGLSWILSMGNEEKITEAKNMIIAAVLGLLVVLGAYAITNLLAQIFTEAIPK